MTSEIYDHQFDIYYVMLLLPKAIRSNARVYNPSIAYVEYMQRVTKFSELFDSLYFLGWSCNKLVRVYMYPIEITRDHVSPY